MFYKITIQKSEFIVKIPEKFCHMQEFMVEVDDVFYTMMWNQKINVFFIKHANFWQVVSVSEVHKTSEGSYYESKLSYRPKTLSLQIESEIEPYHKNLKRIVSGKKDISILNTPITGKILKVPNIGPVTKGETLFVVDAMKMENQISSPISGNLTEVFIKNGAMVKKGDRLAKFDAF